MIRWLRAKQWVWQRIIPNMTSNSERLNFVLLKNEYHSWNSFQKEDACGQWTNICQMVWHSEGQKGQKGEATFFILCNRLFVGKIWWIILYWNIANFISFMALNGNRYSLLSLLNWACMHCMHASCMQCMHESCMRHACTALMYACKLALLHACFMHAWSGCMHAWRGCMHEEHEISCMKRVHACMHACMKRCMHAQEDFMQTAVTQKLTH